MKITIENITQTRKTAKVTLDSSELGSKMNSVLNSIRAHANIPGFRIGKAPIDMVRKSYEKTFMEELYNKIQSDVVSEVRKSLRLISIIEMNIPEIKEGLDLDVQLTCDVSPEINLPKYKEIEVQEESVDVSEQDIESTIAQLQKERANYKIVERSAEKGDYVKVSYVGKIKDYDGKKDETLIKDIKNAPAIWGSQRMTWEEAGNEEFATVPAVSTGIIGMKAGDKKTVSMNLPENFPVENLASKEVFYDIEVHEVRTIELHPLNETLFESLEEKTLEGFRAKIKLQIENRKKYNNTSAKRRQITEYLISHATFEMPESLLKSEIENVLKDMVSSAARRGISEAEMENHKKMFIDQAKKTAENNIKLYLSLDEIAKLEKITISQEDLQMALYQQSLHSQKRPEQIIKELRNDSEKLHSLKQNTLYAKTMDFLQKHAKTSK